ncbi:ankyrin repeat domain-containing protein [Wolbachia endosymbiont (group B) of Sphaerophoria taeniata]|uniref:ankyrin repeat domain-containing protein n=1 Tax=Wolbachia endosymbiont (group B) of Sphaerophoria taeniata TaxID=2954058 RepID=UPI00221EA6D8|nr:ankyrin repeat domain-containing protein [Wolbachia endosymbiont (group B) of Sphaerophoria taeniata]
MTGEYESLKTVLKTIEAKEDLNKDNIIQKIQEELKEQNQDLYQKWEKDKFDVNHAFDTLLYEKQTLLIIAADNHYKKTVGFLIGAKADVNAKDGFDRTALHSAAIRGRKEIVEVLIGAKADVNAKDGFDRTALHSAAIRGRKEIVEVLIGAGADVNVRDKSGYTALHFISCKKIVEVLFKEGAKVNAVNKDGKTALHYAPLFDSKEIVEVLIGRESNVNAVDKYGKTPLDYATDQDVVKALLDEGGGSFVKARNKAKIAGGVTGLLGTAIAVALFTTGIIAAQLIPIVIAVVAVTAAALVVGCATYALLKPSTKVDGAEKPSAVLTTNEQQGAA